MDSWIFLLFIGFKSITTFISLKKIVLNLLKNWEDSTAPMFLFRVPTVWHPVLLLLMFYISMLYLLQLIYQYWYIISNKNHTILDFLSVYLMCIICSRILPRIPHYIYLSCLLRLLWTVKLSQHVLVFDDFDTFWGLPGKYFVQCPSAGLYLMFSSWLDRICRFGEEESQRKSIISITSMIHSIRLT